MSISTSLPSLTPPPILIPESAHFWPPLQPISFTSYWTQHYSPHSTLQSTLNTTVHTQYCLGHSTLEWAVQHYGAHTRVGSEYTDPSQHTAPHLSAPHVSRVHPSPLPLPHWRTVCVGAVCGTHCTVAPSVWHALHLHCPVAPNVWHALHCGTQCVAHTALWHPVCGTHGNALHCGTQCVARTALWHPVCGTHCTCTALWHPVCGTHCTVAPSVWHARHCTALWHPVCGTHQGWAICSVTTLWQHRDRIRDRICDRTVIVKWQANFFWTMIVIVSLNGLICWAILNNITRYWAISPEIGRY